MFLVLDLDYENKKINAFKPINSILYRYMGVIIDIEERYALQWSLHVSWIALCVHMPITTEDMQTIFSKPYLLKKLFTLLHSTLVDKLLDQFNAQ